MLRINRIILLLLLMSTASCSFMISPQILDVTPAPSENLLTTNLIIQIEFSKDMERESTEQAFALYVSSDRGNKIEGIFQWTDDKHMEFTPMLSSLEWPAQYAIYLQTPALDQDGNNLPQNFTSSFSLLSNLARPLVTASYPVNGSTNFSIYSNLIIEFSLNMSTNETRDAFSISPNVQGNINIYSNKLIFSPDSPFQNGVYYTVNLAASARATNSVTLLNDLEIYFLPGQDFTIPTLLALRTNLSTFSITNNQDNIEKFCTNLILVFNTAMDRSSVEQGLSFEPGLNFYLSWLSNDVAQINILELMLPATNYTLSLDQSVSSIYGRQLLEEIDRTFYTGGPLSTLPQYMGTTEGSNNNFLVEKINYYTLSATNSISLTVKFSSITNMDWISVFNNSEIQYISGENGIKQGEISDIIPRLGSTDEFIFVIEKIAVSNIYKLSLKGGINGIQDILQNHLPQSIDIYFTATNY